LAKKLLLLLYNDMKSDKSSNDDSVLRQAILNYLEEHPDAMEALDGIAEWWIARSQIRVEVEALGRVLEELTQSGVLKEMRVTGKTYYRLARRKVN
jgi:Fe2+ or Zn2+ uptake regulation protein